MQLENLNSKEQIILEFYNWLFDKEISLNKEVDLSLAPYYEDPCIYYPDCISKLLGTEAFKRLGRISQLSLVIFSNSNAYHNRLEHSKGVYNRKLEEFIYNFQDISWRKNIERSNLKLYLLADLIKMLGHDIGHLPLSHSIESQIFKKRGVHELVGKRIMTENFEINSILLEINTNLPTILKELYDKEVLNFKEHDESNYDVDRMDFLQRDTLYLGNPRFIPHQQYKTIKTSKYGTIDVYPYTSLRHIEEFLHLRANNYKNYYFSLSTSLYQNLYSTFVGLLINSNNSCGDDLKQFLQNLQRSETQDIDLDEYLKWDDIRFYDNVITIAQNHPDEVIRYLAMMSLPSMEAFLNLIYSHMNIRNSSQYSPKDKKFLNKIKQLIKGENALSKNMRNPNFSSDNILISDKTTNHNDQEKTLTMTFKSYNKKEPIYIKDENGEIHELSEHPQRSYDWNRIERIIDLNYTYFPILRENSNLSNESIKSRYKTLTEVISKSPTKKTEINMQPLKVDHNIEDEFFKF